MPTHITHIEHTPLKHMRRLVASPDCASCFLSEEVLWTPICIVGLASLEVTDEVTDGTRLYTTKLSYTLAQRPTPDAEPMAYRLTLADGRQLIFGTTLRPYPVATITDTHEDKANGRSSCSVQVEQKNAPFPPLELLS